MPCPVPLNAKGFTLIELMVVVIVLGVVVAIGLPNFISLRENALRASCISNQKTIVEGALLYASEVGVSAGTINVTVLQPLNYVETDVSECPSSATDDYDDYRFVLTGGTVTSVRCDVEPTEHAWTPPTQ